MTSTQDLHRRALDVVTREIHAIDADQWHAATPCTEWDVRALVNHLVVEQLWAPELLAGRSIEEVGARFDGDQLGGDPVEAWDHAAAEALEAFASPWAIEQKVQLSYGAVPARDYCGEMAMDAAVHAWDLARGAGLDDRMDPELVSFCLSVIEPRAAELSASGLFAPPIPVADDADPQTRLLALLGRAA